MYPCASEFAHPRAIRSVEGWRSPPLSFPTSVSTRFESASGERIATVSTRSIGLASEDEWNVVVCIGSCRSECSSFSFFTARWLYFSKWRDCVRRKVVFVRRACPYRPPRDERPTAAQPLFQTREMLQAIGGWCWEQDWVSVKAGAADSSPS